MTYRELRKQLHDLTEEQLDSDVTVETVMEGDVECFRAELAICGVEHSILDEDHPVIRISWD